MEDSLVLESAPWVRSMFAFLLGCWCFFWEVCCCSLWVSGAVELMVLSGWLGCLLRLFEGRLGWIWPQVLVLVLRVSCWYQQVLWGSWFLCVWRVWCRCVWVLYVEYVEWILSILLLVGVLWTIGWTWWFWFGYGGMVVALAVGDCVSNRGM